MASTPQTTNVQADAHTAAQGEMDEVARFPVGPRSVVAERGDPRVDQPRVQATQILEAAGVQTPVKIKLGYPPDLYAAVTSTLYFYFGTVGAVVQVSAVVSAVVLCVVSRRTTAFRMLAGGAALLAASIVVWALLVAPVNSEWSRLAAAGSEPLPAAYARLRNSWEYGHLAAFLVWLAGYVLLQIALVAGPDDRRA